MQPHKVVWSQGMFLQPQHLQQQQRHVERLIEGRSEALTPCPWGFAALAIDEPALALGKLALHAARGLLPDGTPFDLPAREPLPLPLDVPADARDERVLLAVPLRRPGALDADIEARDDDGLTRHLPYEVEVADDTLSDAPTALLQLGRLRVVLMMEREASDAYATLAVARVVERRADGSVRLDPQFIPPCLATRCSPVLSGWLGEVLGALRQRGSALAQAMSRPGPGGVAEIAGFLQLQLVNRFEPLLRHRAGLAVVHPAQCYAELLMLAGELRTFAHDSRRPPDYPDYRHDDLQATFAPLVDDLRRSLSQVIEQGAVPIELQQHRHGVRVALVPDAELLRSAAFVFAVNAQMPLETLRARFAAQVKVGPVERLRDLVTLALPGIALHPLPVAPRQLPYHAGFSYFALDRGGELWKQVQQSAGGLGMHIAGEFPGLELECWALREH